MKHTVSLTIEFFGDEPLTEQEKGYLSLHVLESIPGVVLGVQEEPVLYITNLTIEHNENK